MMISILPYSDYAGKSASEKSNRLTCFCPECGELALLVRQERRHRHAAMLYFACSNWLCGVRFASELNYSHLTKSSRSARPSIY